MTRLWVFAACLAVGGQTCLAETQKKSLAQHAPGHKKAVVEELSGQGYGMAGCGLGSILFGPKPGLIQIVAVTFNSTMANQTFAITSGTSNCEATDSAETAELFIHANREALETDISRGDGEALNTLAQIVGCNQSAALGSGLQSKFGTIFPQAGVSTDKVSSSILGIIRSDSSIANSCNATI